jgi:hypothetical protein
MARRPEFPANVMTRDQLKELKRSLSMLSPHTVQDNYQKMLDRCRLRGGALPHAAHDAGTRGTVESPVELAQAVKQK